MYYEKTLPDFRVKGTYMSNRIFSVSICASAAFAILASQAIVTASNAANAAPTRMLKSDYRIAKDKLERDYRAAKRICVARKEAEQSACLKDAEAAHDKAERDLRGTFYGSH